MKLHLWLILFIGIAVIMGSMFALGRASKQSDRYAVVPSYTAAAFQLTSKGVLTPMKDTTDLAAVQGLQGRYIHHVYKLDSVSFNVYYFRTGWTAYVKSGGYINDTTLFVVYQRNPVCVSAAVSALIRAKYLGR